MGKASHGHLGAEGNIDQPPNAEVFPSFTCERPMFSYKGSCRKPKLRIPKHSVKRQAMAWRLEGTPPPQPRPLEGTPPLQPRQKEEKHRRKRNQTKKQEKKSKTKTTNHQKQINRAEQKHRATLIGVWSLAESNQPSTPKHASA